MKGPFLYTRVEMQNMKVRLVYTKVRFKNRMVRITFTKGGFENMKVELPNLKGFFSYTIGLLRSMKAVIGGLGTHPVFQTSLSF